MAKSFNLIAAVPGYISTLQFSILSLKKRVPIVMSINKIMLFSLISILSLLSVTCKNEVTAVEDNVKPGRRDYEWEITTINEDAPNNLYTQLGGVTPDEIWIMGSAGDFDKTILKYNGIKVSRYGQLSIDPRAVFGLSQNEIWFSGSQFDIWKYNGSSISKFSTDSLDGYYNSFVVDIWGSDKNNLYAVGSGTITSTGQITALIMNYNGISWNYPIPPVPDLHLVRIRKGTTDNNYYLLGVIVKSGEPDVYGFYKFDGASILPFNLNDESETIDKSITVLDNFLYFYDNKEIYKMMNNGVQHFISLENTNVNGTQIWGRNEKDFFIQTIDGIGHYNGNNLETLSKIEGNFGIFDGLILDSDVYFVGFYRESFKFFLIHGKVK